MFIDWEFLGDRASLKMLLRIALKELKRGIVPRQSIRMQIALTGLLVPGCMQWAETQEYMSRMSTVN